MLFGLHLLRIGLRGALALFISYHGNRGCLRRFIPDILSTLQLAGIKCHGVSKWLHFAGGFFSLADLYRVSFYFAYFTSQGHDFLLLDKVLRPAHFEVLDL